MNKTIKEATKSEIAQAYKDKVPTLIYNYRKNSLTCDIKRISELGEVEYQPIASFNLKMAQKYNLGFEFRIWQSNKMRKERIKKRITDYINTGKAQFLTLTFSPAFLSRDTTEETRRRYIARFLKEQCEYYVANIDYGEDNGREHYHAVIVPKNDRIDYQPYNDIFDKSRIYAEPIIISNKSLDNISRYINKLTNHALKIKGAYQRLIFSRSRL